MADDDHDTEMLARWLEAQLLRERAALEARHMSLVKNFKQMASGETIGEEHEYNDKDRWSPRDPVDSFELPLKLPTKSDEFLSYTRPSQAPGTLSCHIEVPATPPVDPSRMKPFARDQQRESKDCFYDFVVSNRFEYFFGSVIVLNVVVMAVESQYIGLGIGYGIGFDSFREPKEVIWPGAKVILSVIDYFFGVLYCFELLAKILALRGSFFDLWNFFDATIVVAWCLDKILSSVAIPIDFMILRILRLFRLLRLVRLARKLAGFDQLWLMFTALKGSIVMLGWTFLMLFSCQLIFALVFNQVLVPYYIQNDHISMTRKLECFKLFGTFARSMLSMYELTLANWIPIARFLMDDVSEFFVIFSILYKVTFGFAVIAVINGCFIKETFKAVDADDLLMIINKEREVQVHMKKMKMFFDIADASNDGTLSYEEFVGVCETNEIKTWLGAQGLDASDARVLFKLIRNEHGEISIGDLVRGVKRLKGPARSLDFAFEAHEALRREREMALQLREVLRGLKTMHRDPRNATTVIV